MIIVGLFYILAVVFLFLAAVGVQSSINLLALGILFLTLALGCPNLGLVSIRDSPGVRLAR